MRRGVLRGVRPVVLVAGRQLLGRRRRGALEQRAHLVDVREDDVLGIVETPTLRESPARCQRGTPHQPGRPDVSVDTALVAHRVADTGLLEQGVVLLAMLLGNVTANLGHLLIEVRGAVRLVDRGPDGAQEHVGQLERAVVRDVEPVEQSVADEVEVVAQRLTGGAGFSPQALEEGTGVLVRVELPACGIVGAVRRDHGGVLRRASTGDRRGTTHQTEELHRRQTGPLPRVDEEVTRGDDSGAGEGHVLSDHRDVVLTTAVQVFHERLVVQLVRIDRLDLAVGRLRGRLANLVPLLRTVTPQLAVEDLRDALDALGECFGCDGFHLPVAEPVDVGGPPGLDRGAVERCHVAVSEAERFGMHLRPVGGHRSGEVQRIQVPRPWTGCLEGQLLLRLGVHRVPFWRPRRTPSLAIGERPDKSRAGGGVRIPSARPACSPRRRVSALGRRQALIRRCGGSARSTRSATASRRRR